MSARMERLLALLARDAAAAPVEQRPAEEWAELCEAAAWHGLLPLLHHRLRQHGGETSVPPGLWRRLEEAWLVDSLRATARRAQLAELLDALADAGVPVIPLKGACLAERVYPSPELRPMSDLDLLVPAPALPSATRVLEELGYAQDGEERPRHRHAVPFRRAGRLPVELHHTIEPCEAPAAVPLPEIWMRARPGRVAGTDVFVLAPEDLLLHVAFHMCRSHVLGASLVSIHDVHAWVERFGATADWTAVVARSGTPGARRFVYASLALARATLGAGVPAAVLDALGTPEDEVAVEDAAQLLVTPPAISLGAKAATAGESTALDILWRLTRVLAIEPVRRRLTRRSPGAPAVGAANGDRARWGVLAHLLLHPAAGLEATQRVAQVRALRRWAAQGEQ